MSSGSLYELSQRERLTQIMAWELEGSLEERGYETPEFRYRDNDDFEDWTVGNWATQELLNMLENGIYVEDAMYDLANKFYDYATKAKSPDSRRFFYKAWSVIDGWSQYLYDAVMGYEMAVGEEFM